MSNQERDMSEKCPFFVRFFDGHKTTTPCNAYGYKISGFLSGDADFSQNIRPHLEPKMSPFVVFCHP